MAKQSPRFTGAGAVEVDDPADAPKHSRAGLLAPDSRTRIQPRPLHGEEPERWGRLLADLLAPEGLQAVLGFAQQLEAKHPEVAEALRDRLR